MDVPPSSCANFGERRVTWCCCLPYLQFCQSTSSQHKIECEKLCSIKVTSNFFKRPLTPNFGTMLQILCLFWNGQWESYLSHCYQCVLHSFPLHSNRGLCSLLCWTGKLDNYLWSVPNVPVYQLWLMTRLNLDDTPLSQHGMIKWHRGDGSCPIIVSCHGSSPSMTQTAAAR